MLDTTDTSAVQALVLRLVIKAAQGALSGLLAAAAVDVHTFQTWKTAEDAKGFNWATAGQRWLFGAVSGAIGALGFGALV